MARPKNTPEQYNNKRERILASAYNAMKQNGIRSLKINTIARDTGVADGTIYLYFQDKDDLLFSVVERFSDDYELAHAVRYYYEGAE